MTLYYDETGDTKLPFESLSIAETVIQGTLRYLESPYDAEVNLLLTMNNEIREINQEHRNIDKSTDVLSFPAIDFEVPGDFSDVSTFDLNPETNELILGDIVISKEKVLSQGDEYGHSPLREYAFLIVHSVLHLVGYDHMEEDEKETMERIQKAIMEYLKISR